MKWRGRRESTNIIDLRSTEGVASFNVRWGEDGDIVIDTDGTVYGRGSVNISLVIPNPPTSKITDWMPTMTIGQKNSLRELIQVVSMNAVLKDVKNPSNLEDVVLAQYVQSIINGNI